MEPACEVRRGLRSKEWQPDTQPNASAPKERWKLRATEAQGRGHRPRPVENGRGAGALAAREVRRWHWRKPEPPAYIAGSRAPMTCFGGFFGMGGGHPQSRVMDGNIDGEA